MEGCVIASTSEGLYQVFPDKAVQLASLGRVYGAAVSPKYPGKIFVTGFDGFQVCDYVVKNGKVSITKSWRYDQITRPLFKIIIADNGLLWATTLSDGIVRLTPKNDSLNDFDSEFIESNYGLERTSQLTVATVGNTLYVNDGQFKTAKLDNPTDSLVLEPDTLLNKIFSKDEIISHFVYCKYSDEFFVHTQQACWRINRSNPAINSVIHFRIPLSTVYNLNVVDSIVLFSTNFGLVKGDITDTTAYNPAQQPYNALINAIYFNDKSVFHGYRYFKPDASERNYNMFTTGTDPEHLTDSILSDNEPSIMNEMSCNPCITNANALPSGSRLTPYMASVSITIKCHVPIPPGDGTITPNVASTNTISPVARVRCSVNPNALKPRYTA